jgi:hypothetical protein
VAAALVEALEGLDVQYPTVEGVTLKEIQSVRRVLESEADHAKSKKPSKRSNGNGGCVVTSKAPASSAPKSHLIER